MSTPKYYQFPNGAQPLELSRYLTSNGGQALQYVARSCRLDDESNKHNDAADDLVKAIHFLYDEIKRVGNERDLEKVRNLFKPEAGKDEPEKIPVSFEGPKSIEVRAGEPVRACLGTAHITDTPLSEESWEAINSLDWHPAYGASTIQAYLTFEPK
ncbi:MAG: hypothetical protein PHW63_09885 [Alphaproteobacteria bacterium]|nr:hypothetical protein [Alphaproteobacteria bacterium]